MRFRKLIVVICAFGLAAANVEAGTSPDSSQRTVEFASFVGLTAKAISAPENLLALIAAAGASPEALKSIASDLRGRSKQPGPFALEIRQNKLFNRGQDTGVEIASYQPFRLVYAHRSWTYKRSRSFDKNYFELVKILEGAPAKSARLMLALPAAQAEGLGGSLNGAVLGGAVGSLIGLVAGWGAFAAKIGTEFVAKHSAKLMMAFGFAAPGGGELSLIAYLVLGSTIGAKLGAVAGAIWGGVSESDSSKKPVPGIRLTTCDPSHVTALLPIKSTTIAEVTVARDPKPGEEKIVIKSPEAPAPSLDKLSKEERESLAKMLLACEKPEDVQKTNTLIQTVEQEVAGVETLHPTVPAPPAPTSK